MTVRKCAYCRKELPVRIGMYPDKSGWYEVTVCDEVDIWDGECCEKVYVCDGTACADGVLQGAGYNEEKNRFEKK